MSPDKKRKPNHNFYSEAEDLAENGNDYRDSIPTSAGQYFDSLPAEERQSIQVMVVVPDEQDYYMLRDMLQEYDNYRYIVRWIPDFESASTAIDSNEYDIFLIDQDLEPFDGIELVRQASQKEFRHPCILLCQKSSKQLEDAAMLAGASDLFEIPLLQSSILQRSIRFAVERKRNSDHLIYLAQRDCLTGLPNRMMFEDRLQHALKRADRYNQRVGLLFVDLDGFKKANDTLGHEVGDELLKIAAHRMLNNVREVDMVARIGGDEFIIILESIVNSEDGAIVANRLNCAINKPVSILRKEVTISASIGIAVFPDDARNDEQLIAAADQAMYLAKSQGGNSFVFISKDRNAKAANRFALEVRLEQAMERGELYINYHPQIDLEMKRVTGAAGLLYWRSPNRGDILYDEFAPLLEGSNLAYKIGLWVLEKVFTQSKIWHDHGIRKIKVEVNLLKKLFFSDDLPEFLLNILQSTKIEPQYMVLGLTENMLKMERKVERQISSLKSLGIRLSLRELDTGESSISYLERYPIDIIKIEPSLVSKITKEKRCAAKAQAMIAIAKEMGIDTIAENNDNELMFAVLQNMNCSAVQSPVGLITDNIKGISAFRKRITEQEQELAADLPTPVTSSAAKQLFKKFVA